MKLDLMSARVIPPHELPMKHCNFTTEKGMRYFFQKTTLLQKYYSSITAVVNLVKFFFKGSSCLAL